MPGRVRTVPKSKSANFVRKSEQFLRAAEAAGARGDWDAAVSSAVHAGIAMADALTVFYLGQRSASQEHGGSIRLLESVSLGSDDIARNARHLSSLLAAKTRAEYEERLLSSSDAEDALVHARRFCHWGREKLVA